MRITTLALAAAALAGAALAQTAGTAPSAGGLVAVESRRLDEVAVRPGVDLAAYRSVVVEPGRASLRKDWLKDMNATRSPSRWLSEDDARQIVDEAAAAVAPAFATVFRERGYAVATASAPGVLRLTPVVTELDVYAPYVPTPGIQRYYQREAGTATLTLEIRDAASGQLVARIVDRGIADEVRRGRANSLNAANGATNAFWFDVLFREWASASAQVLAGAAVRAAP